MKSRAPRRGSTLLTAMGVTLLLALIIFGALAYTGAEQERSGRSVRDIDAQTCSESAAQWGRKYYGDNYPQWNDMLSGDLPGYNNPESPLDRIAEWGTGSFGRIDGQTVQMPDLPPDFRVTISDNIDEFSPLQPEPARDNDLQVVLRAECLIPRLSLPNQTVENLKKTHSDPHNWRGNNVLAETSQTRQNKVVEVVLIHTPGNPYKGQKGSGGGGDQNVSY